MSMYSILPTITYRKTDFLVQTHITYNLGLEYTLTHFLKDPYKECRGNMFRGTSKQRNSSTFNTGIDHEVTSPDISASVYRCFDMIISYWILRLKKRVKRQDKIAKVKDVRTYLCCFYCSSRTAGRRHREWQDKGARQSSSWAHSADSPPPCLSSAGLSLRTPVKDELFKAEQLSNRNYGTTQGHGWYGKLDWRSVSL